MTQPAPKERNEIYSELSFYLKKLWKKHDAEMGLFRDKLPKLKAILADWESEEYRDEKSIGGLREKRDIWLKKIQDCDSLLLLSDAVKGADFAGKQLSLSSIGWELLPERHCHWGMLFLELGVDPYHKIYFPVDCGEVDIEGIEIELIERMGESRDIKSKEFLEVVGFKPNTQEFKMLKKGLESRGWVWRRKRISGKLERVVSAPEV